MQNIGRANQIMMLLDKWMDADMDKIYHLNSEDYYMSMPGIRGNRYRLK